MTAPELKPCPFCEEGKTASTYFDHEQGDKWGYASCDACGARGPDVRTEYDRNDNALWRGEAIAAWNTRSDTATIKDAVDMMADQHGWVRRDAADTATWNAAIRAAAAIAHSGVEAYGAKMRAAANAKEKRDWQSMLMAAVDIEHAILALLKPETTDG